MTRAAQEFVDAFDFTASRRFIEERARQLRRETSTIAVAIVVLLVAGAVQHVLRHWGGLPTFDRTDAAFAVLLVLCSLLAARRTAVRAQLPGPLLEGPALRGLWEREAGRVRRERVLAAGAILISVAALLALTVDSVLDRAWGFALGFAALALGASTQLRLYVGRGARRRAERYIRGEIDGARYLSDRDLDTDAPSDAGRPRP